MFHRETTVTRLTSVILNLYLYLFMGEMFIAKNSIVKIIFGTQN